LVRILKAQSLCAAAHMPSQCAQEIMVARGRIDSLCSPFGRLWRLSPLRGSDELPTRGFSERQVIDSAVIYQPVTGASVA